MNQKRSIGKGDHVEGAFRFTIRPRTAALAALIALGLLAGPAAGPVRADELSEIAFTEGFVALEAGDAAAAIEHFETAVARDPKDAPAWYWLGIARARAGDDDGAIAAYNRALALDPDYVQAAYARGNALSRQGEGEAAREDWSFVDEKVPGSRLAERARLRLREGGAGASGKDWQLTAGMGVEYDTNVFLFPNIGDPPPPAPGGKAFRPPDHRFDTRFRYYVNGGYRLLTSGRWRVSTRQYFQAATQLRSEDVNFVEYSPSFSIDYESDPVAWGLDYIFTLNGLGGDRFLARHAIQPRLRLQEGDNYYTRLFYRYSHSDFNTGGARMFDRSGHDHRVGIDQFALLFDQRGYARAGVEWRRDITDGFEYRGSFFTLSGEMVAPLPADSQLNLSAAQTWADYDHESAFSRPNIVFFRLGPTFNRTIVPVTVGDPKSERTTTGSIAVTRQMREHWSSSAGYAYTVNQSSIDAFDYNRSIFSFFVNYDF